MKKLFLLLLAGTAIGLASCKEDPIKEDPMLTIDGATGNELIAKQLTSMAQDFTIKVLANGAYTVNIPSASQLWLEEVVPQTRALASSEIKFRVKANTTLDMREAIITLTCKDFSQKYKITQSPPPGALDIQISDVNIANMATWNGDKTILTVEGLSNRETTIKLYVGPTSAFKVWIDNEATPWLTVRSAEGSQDVNIQVGTTYNSPSEPMDYSPNRVGVVHFESLDKTASVRMIVKQNPRVAGDYILTEPDPEDAPPTDAQSSQLGQQLLAELPAFRVGISTLKVEGPMTEYDFQALVFSGAWLTDDDKMNNMAPNISELDLSKATFENFPANFMPTAATANTTLKKVIFPEGMKTIGASAFLNCQALTDINIPSTVESIGEKAFYTCPVTGPFVIPQSLKSVGISAFQGNRLTGLSFENPTAEYCKDGTSRLEVGNLAFATNDANPAKNGRGGSLSEDLVIPDWVSTIGDKAFAGLFYENPGQDPTAEYATGSFLAITSTANATIKIGKNVTSIGSGAFHSNMGVTKFDFGTGTPIVITQDTGTGSVGRGLFAKTGITEFTWPISGREITVAGDADGVVTLPASIFYGCQSLKKVTIGYGVTHIGASAFSGATIRLIASNSGNVGQVKLDELTLPTSLVEFSGSAFSNCLGVEYVHIVDGNGVVTQSTTPGLWDLTKTRLKTVQRSAFDGLSYISLSNPSVPVGTGITEIRFPSTIRAFYNTALSRAQIGGKKLYLPDVFKPAAGDGTIPAVAAENAGKEYIFTSNSSTNSVFANITPAPIYTYVPASDWGTINWEN